MWHKIFGDIEYVEYLEVTDNAGNTYCVPFWTVRQIDLVKYVKWRYRMVKWQRK